MRFHEGNFAYEVEPRRDPSTQLLLAWRFTVYRLRPIETVITRGEAKTREQAETQARKIVVKLLRRSSGQAA